MASFKDEDFKKEFEVEPTESSFGLHDEGVGSHQVRGEDGGKKWIASNEEESEESSDDSEDEEELEGEPDLETTTSTKCCYDLYDAGVRDHYKCVFKMIDLENLGTPILKECCKSKKQATKRVHYQCLVNIYRYTYFKICVPTKCCKNIRQAVHKCHFKCFETIGNNLPTQEPEDPTLKELFEKALVNELDYMRNLPDFFIQKRFGHLNYQID